MLIKFDEFLKNNHGLYRIFLFLIFVVGWVALHPYTGIWHDGRLYYAQALLKINPYVYQSDIFFKYGSQDSYSIFSSCYVFFIQYFGVETAAMSLMLVTQLLFIGALWLVCRRLYGPRVGALAACALAILPAFYGRMGILTYAETFLTARNVAEPFCLLAIYYLLKERVYLSAAILIVAAAFHPLLVLPVISVWWVFQFLGNKKYGYFLLVIPVIFALAVKGISPFSILLDTYDAFWWEQVSRRNQFVIPFEWPIEDWVILGLDFCCVYFVMRMMEGTARRFLMAVLLSSFLFMLMAILGTSVLHNVLLTSVQFWRAHWILHFVAMSAVPYLLLALWRQGNFATYSAKFLALSCLIYPWPQAFPVIAFAGCLYIVHRMGRDFSATYKRIGLYLDIGIGCFIILYLTKTVSDIYAAMYIPNLGQTSFKEDVEALVFSPSVLNSVIIVSCGLFFVLKRRVLAILFLLAMMLPLTFYWDQRTSWQKYITEEHAQPHPFKQYFSEHGEVYWHYENILATWTLLGKASYYSNIQGAGILFNRGTAVDFFNRAKYLGMQRTLCYSMQYASVNNSLACAPNKEVVKQACLDVKNLDALIFSFEITGLKAVRWQPTFSDGSKGNTYYLYSCSNFRNS